MALRASTFQERRRPRKRRGRVVAFLFQGLLLSALLGGFAYGLNSYVSTSGDFVVRHVPVEGDGLTAEEITAIRAAAGVAPGANVLSVDIDAVRERVAGMPGIRDCEVVRAPPQTLIIRAEKRVPEAGLLVHGHLYEIDGEGVILRELDALSEHTGPLITNVPDLAIPEAGQQLAAPELLEAIEVWRAFATTALSQDVNVAEIAAPKAREVVMFCDELGFEIRWGRVDHARQAERLDILWRELGGDLPCREYLDLRFDEDLVCK